MLFDCFLSCWDKQEDRQKQLTAELQQFFKDQPRINLVKKSLTVQNAQKTGFYLIDELTYQQNESFCSYRLRNQSGKGCRILKKYRQRFGETEKQNFRAMMLKLQRITHRNIQKVISVDFSQSRRFEITCENLTGDNLLTRLSNCPRPQLTPTHLRDILQTIFSSLHFLHSINLFHGDLRPQNLVYSNNHPSADLKISNFGSAVVTNDQSLRKTLGFSSQYSAPQDLKRHSRSHYSDLWACGVLMFFLLTGRYPFKQYTMEQVKKGVIQFQPSEVQTIGIRASDLIRKLMMFRAEDRIEVKEVLIHPFFKQHLYNFPNQFGADYQQCDTVAAIRNSIQFFFMSQQIIQSQESMLYLALTGKQSAQGDETNKSLLLSKLAELELNMELHAQMKKVYQALTDEGQISIKDAIARYRACCKQHYADKLSKQLSFLGENGAISRKRLWQFVRNPRVSELDISRLIVDSDRNNDKQINMVQFVELVAKVRGIVLHSLQYQEPIL